MAQNTISGNQDLAEKIRARRHELHLTIEEAARRAGIGTKTWCRYEAGESIRQDKCKGVCRALNWIQFPSEEKEDNLVDWEEECKHEAWSHYLEENFDKTTALSFVIGSDILLDHIKEDISELSKLPKGSHIGQLEMSMLQSSLPTQFLMNYDYDFLYIMKTKLVELRKHAKWGHKIIAHTVLEEILLVLIEEESEFLMEGYDNLELDSCWNEWAYDILGDGDIDILYSGVYLPPDDSYHFSHWLEEQFYCDED